MTQLEQKNIEEHVLKITTRQFVVYLWGIMFITLMAAGIYYGITSKLEKISDQMSAAATERAALKIDIKNINNRLDQIQQQGEVRYLELKLEMGKKQDRKP